MTKIVYIPKGSKRYNQYAGAECFARNAADIAHSAGRVNSCFAPVSLSFTPGFITAEISFWLDLPLLMVEKLTLQVDP